MITSLAISALLLVSSFFLLSTFRYSRASKALDAYIATFSNLADDQRVPLEVLERINKTFQYACHPCAALFLTFILLKHRFKGHDEAKDKPSIFDDLDVSVRSDVAVTFAALFKYASYRLPIFGIIPRALLKEVDVRNKKTRFVSDAWYVSDHSIRTQPT